MHIKILTVILLLGSCYYSQGQKNYTIALEDSGKIRSTLPERLDSSNTLLFRVNDPVGSFNNYKKMLTDKAGQAVKQLEKLKTEKDQMDILDTVYGIKETDITAVITQLKATIANPIATGSAVWVPRFSTTDHLYYKVELSSAKNSPKDSMTANIESKPLAIIPVTDKTEIGFTVYKKEPFKKLVYNWLQQTAQTYVNIDFPSLRKLKQDITADQDSANRFATKVESLNKKNETDKESKVKELIDEADDLIKKIETTTVNLDKALPKNTIHAADYKQWILHWLWYQKGTMPAFNPFNFTLEENLGNEPDTSKLESLRLKIQSREELYKKMTRLSQIDSIINEIEALRKEKYDLEKAASRFAKQKGNNDKAIAEFSVTARQLNEGIVMVGKNDNTSPFLWMRHHDASTGYQLISDDDKGEYLETDKVIILTHNLRPNERTVLNIQFTEITNDMSLLAEGLSPAIAKLKDAARGLNLNADLPNINSNLKKLTNDLTTKISKIRNLLLALQLYQPALKYLLAQSNAKTDIEETIDRVNSYHSQVANPPKKITGPKKASYSMTTVTSNKGNNAAAPASASPAPDTFSYRVNKLYRMFPMAGINYTANRFNAIDGGGSGQTKNTEDAHVHFVIGLKVFLNKIDIRSPKFFTGTDDHGKSLLLSRISLQVGFEIPKPLRNVYGGIGLDLWPGFCISAGVVANKYTYNVYNAGQAVQSSSLYRPGFYTGISTDISLFTDIAKFLNISK